jgi:iron complex outermembrane receptor protein
MYNKILFILFLVFSSNFLNAQDCDIAIEGNVLDEGSKSPLSFVTVIIQETGNGTITDDQGHFHFQNICPGEYHLYVSHIGCSPIEIHFHLETDTTINIRLEHTPITIDEVEIKGISGNYDAQSKESINKQWIEDNSNKNLSALLENETGVHLIKNGSGISKPVVHGLYGNRLTILNNGVVQSGQQWGNDHSPEIDPLIANRITVIKGTNTLEYGGGNLGSIILVEPRQIEQEPHLHGRLNYVFETNGRGNTLNTQLQKYDQSFAWRLNGTYRITGDKHTPDYYLNNTGLREYSLALQLEKSWEERIFASLFASSFNTKLGILRGSHIGNLTDLQAALNRETPFFTEETFSFGIEPPSQQVSHNLLKAQVKYFLEPEKFFDFTIAGQYNARKEFDTRRGDRSDIPALSLSQFNGIAELKYQQTLSEHWTLKIGQQNNFTHNTNNPETGILPLIPDYISTRLGAYNTWYGNWKMVNLNFGGRYDIEIQEIAAISKTLPREIIRYNNVFQTGSAMMGFDYKLGPNQSARLNFGYSNRNPAINELYSFGLHQGVSGIEEGNEDLKTEAALKTTLGYKIQRGTAFSLNALFYYQRIQNYIFLEPQNEFQLTIRGAFPVFVYEQTDAAIYGLDLSSQYSLNKHIVTELRYSYIRGNDLKQEIPLVYIPPANIYGRFTYRLDQRVKLAKVKVENLELSWDHRYVFRQDHLLASQDFLEAPPAYYLMGLKWTANLVLPKNRMRVFLKAENLLNTRYRDYLNRLRYFSDEPGRNISIGLNLKF